MKTLKLICSLFILSLAALLLAGCGAIDRTLYRPGEVEVLRPAQVVTNTTLTTNYDITLPETNSVTGIITPPVIHQVIQPVVTYQILPAVTLTNLEPIPMIESSIKAVGASPLPWAGTAGSLLGLLYSGYRSIRNRKLAEVCVTGMEVARKFLNETEEGKELDKVIRKKLEDHQIAAGVYLETKAMVDKLTGKTT